MGAIDLLLLGLLSNIFLRSSSDGRRKRRRRRKQPKKPQSPQKRKRKNHQKRSPLSAKANNRAPVSLPSLLRSNWQSLKRASTLSIMIKMVSSDLKISVVDLMSLVKL